MKTEWRPRTYKRYPGWGCRAIVTGGYKTSHKRTWVNKAGFTQTEYIHATLLIRYEITYNGAYFFSVPQRKLALPLIRKYHKEKSNA